MKRRSFLASVLAVLTAPLLPRTETEPEVIASTVEEVELTTEFDNSWQRETVHWLNEMQCAFEPRIVYADGDGWVHKGLEPFIYIPDPERPGEFLPEAIIKADGDLVLGFHDYED